MPVREGGQGEPSSGQHVPFSGHVQAHTPGERRAFAPAATEDTGERDSPLEGSGFEPSVPLPRLSSIRAVRAKIIGRIRMSFGETESSMSLPSRKTQHLLPKSVFNRPESDRWNLASATFPDPAPMVGFHLPPLS